MTPERRDESDDPAFHLRWSTRRHGGSQTLRVSNLVASSSPPLTSHRLVPSVSRFPSPIPPAGPCAPSTDYYYVHSISSRFIPSISRPRNTLASRITALRSAGRVRDTSSVTFMRFTPRHRPGGDQSSVRRTCLSDRACAHASFLETN